MVNDNGHGAYGTDITRLSELRVIPILIEATVMWLQLELVLFVCAV